MSELDKILDEATNHYDDGNDYVTPAKQAIKDLIINLIEQESFYDPTTKQTTFYTDDIVDRIKKL